MPQLSDNFINEIIGYRHWLHEHPEISYKEKLTTEFIKDKLASWGLKLHPFESVKTGGYVDIGTGGKPIAGYRADIDALPIQENKNHTIRSQHAGVMHACGHDFHTSFGLGLAGYFSQHSEELNGTLRILFQPAEETIPDGASQIHREKLFGDMHSIFAVHIDSRYQTGQIAVKQGTACASSTLLKLKFKGPGGHTSRPHETVDLIRVTALYINQITGYLKSSIDSRDDFTMVFGNIHGGRYHNIIPDEISLHGTLRNFDNDVLQVLLQAIHKYNHKFATFYNCTIGADIPNSTPAIINHPDMYREFIEFIDDSKYSTRLHKMDKPSMGADDFAYYARRVPSLYFQIGAEGKGSSHSSDFLISDDVIQPALEFLIDYVRYQLK